MKKIITKHIEEQIKKDKTPFHLRAYIYIIFITISWTLYIILTQVWLKVFFALLGMFTLMYVVIIAVVKGMSIGVPWALNQIKDKRRK